MLQAAVVRVAVRLSACYVDFAQTNLLGKSFLLTSVYLWCIVNRRKCKAYAPTGAGTEKETPPFP